VICFVGVGDEVRWRVDASHGGEDGGRDSGFTGASLADDEDAKRLALEWGQGQG
jgi:hypothetical protein